MTKQYSVRAELDLGDHVTPADALSGALADHGPEVAPGANGHVVVTMTVSAQSLRHATRVSLTLFDQLGRVVRLEVSPAVDAPPAAEPRQRWLTRIQ